MAAGHLLSRGQPFLSPRQHLLAHIHPIIQATALPLSAARLTVASSACSPLPVLRGGGFFGGGRGGAPYRPPNNYAGIDRRAAPGAPPGGERYSPGRYSPRSRSRSRSRSPRCVLKDGRCFL